ncbi:MAG: VWA domain-containing protein, partial [Cytophagia bacterium]|nr:VWA domain-containing protein [Cytophagia bacterium]
MTKPWHGLCRIANIAADDESPLTAYLFSLQPPKSQTMNQTPFNAAAPTATTDASYVFNVLILDESGSMGSIASAAKEVFEGYLHRLIQEQQDIPDLTQYINMWTFGKPYVNENIPLVKINTWDKVFPEYRPSGNTPMFDAIGMSIHKLKESLRILDLQKEQYQV